VELGKELANNLLPAIRDGEAVPDVDASTRGLIDQVRGWRD
jgi:glucose-6-phosphate isomerase